MKYIFFGTPDFAARCLDVLLENGLIPMAIVCNPDRPTGRKKIITPPPVKTAAEAWNARNEDQIEVLQPEKLDAAFQETLRGLQPDLFIVFSYGKIFRKDVLGIPKLGLLGVHPSFLPQYRGPSPFLTALLDGQTETGVTLYLLDPGIDSGPIVAKSKPVPILPTETSHSLAFKLADVGAQLLVKTLPDFIQGTITPQPQEESQATYTKKFKSEDGFVDSADLAEAVSGSDPAKAKMIFNKIRALNPEPGVWTMRDGKRIKLLEAEIREGKLQLLVTQMEGEKPREVARN